MDCPPEAHTLSQPLPDLAAWTAHFQAAQIPVLASSAEALEALRVNEDEVDANLIGETVSGDPLMTLRVLAHAAANRPPRMVTDTGTVTAAVVMMGITPFFRAFGPAPTVEDRLRDDPQALAGLQAVLRRSHRAATFALSFAVHRMDPEAALIHQAALLHDFAELLLWCHAPGLALELGRRQQADPALRSAAVQSAVLNVELAELQLALMRAWRLHDLLIKTADERHAEQPNVRAVALGVRLARHSAQSWENAALPDDYSDVAGLLNLSLGAARQLVHDIGA
jgi:HD-like signal output (HDOD) protein